MWNSVSKIVSLNIKYGYKSDRLIENIIQKNEIFLAKKFEYLSEYELQKIVTAIAHHVANFPKTKEMIVLDFGGGAGHAFRVAEMIFPNLKFNWIVVETSEMVQQCKLRISRKNLTFISNLSEIPTHLRNIDLVFSNSALQYTPDPLKTLEEILALKSKTLFITRTPLTKLEKQIVYMQPSRTLSNGPGPSLSTLSDGLELYTCIVAPLNKIISMINLKFTLKGIYVEGKWEASKKSEKTYSITLVAHS